MAESLALKRAINQLIARHAFYASIILRRPLRARTDIPTMQVDVFGNISYNPDFIEQLTVPEIVFGLAHECSHYMLDHIARSVGYDPMKAWWAQDCVINELLAHTGVGTLIDGVFRYSGAHEMSWEELYRLAPNSRQGGGGIGHDLDLDSAKQATPEQLEQATAQAVKEMLQARTAAKAVGQLPALLDQLVEAATHVKTPWYQHLEEFFSRRVDNDFSWSEPDRRFLTHGLYIPGYDGVGMGKVIIVADESGSVSLTETAEFFGHINAILQSCQPEKLFLVHLDTKVAQVDEYGPWDLPVEPRRVAHGGTNMVVGIDWAMEHHADADAIVVLTDGFTPFGQDPGVPVFWAITSDVVAPFGRTVHLEVAA